MDIDSDFEHTKLVTLNFVKTYFELKKENERLLNLIERIYREKKTNALTRDDFWVLDKHSKMEMHNIIVGKRIMQ